MYQKLIIVILFSSLLFSSGEIHKGQTYYYYFLKKPLGYSGVAFAKKYTDKQWQELFKYNAKGLKEFLLSQNKELYQFLENKKFDKVIPHLEAFVVQYASNKKNIPQCIE